MLVESWAPTQDQIVRLIAALLLGGLIGLEREVRDKPAGLRTIILICVGACVFTMLSQTVGAPDWNSTRIAAQIVTGIGFLGAGAIIRDRATIVGLTTAATIWAVAAIGMAAGFGQLTLAVLGTVTILLALLVLDLVEKWIGALRDVQEYHFRAPKTPATLDLVTALFDDAHIRARKRVFYEEGELLHFHVHAMGTKVNHERLRMRLASSEEYELCKS